jgi:aldose 1-epimerase
MAREMITLTAGDASCGIRADLGAGLSHLRFGGYAALRESPTDAAEPRQLGCFVMAPFVNRIAAGKFSFFGHDVALPTDGPGHPHAIHGQVWTQPFTVQEAAADRALLVFDGGEDAWPWRYRVTVAVILQPHRLDLVVMLMNRSMQVMPGAIGLHPYFNAGPDTQVRFSAREMFAPGEDKLPQASAPIAPEMDFSTPRAALGVGADHGFGGWDGTAEIGALRLSAKGAPYLQFYAPKDRPYLCLEPQTAPADAPHLPGSPWGMLMPFSTMSMGLTIAHGP